MIHEAAPITITLTSQVVRVIYEEAELQQL